MFLTYFIAIAAFWTGGLLIWNKVYAKEAKEGNS